MPPQSKSRYWLRIGTDIDGGATAPTFNMTFSLAGETVPEAGTPGVANCLGKTIAALAQEFVLSWPDIGRNGFLGIFRPD
jgi:hypothetical protein